jgi:hypothetical protein
LIHFKHSQSDVDYPTNIESNSEECDNHSQKVRTPGDIVKFFGGGKGNGCQSNVEPKSILKRRQSWPNNTDKPTEDNSMTYNHVLTNQSSITSTSSKRNPVPVPNNSKSKRVTSIVDQVNDLESEESVKDTVIERRSGFPTSHNTMEPLDDAYEDAKKPVSLFRQSRQKK